MALVGCGLLVDSDDFAEFNGDENFPKLKSRLSGHGVFVMLGRVLFDVSQTT